MAEKDSIIKRPNCGNVTNYLNEQLAARCRGKRPLCQD
jgi:hypothetical protein